ncbi:hypothetical protein FSP39_013610 [Pinctada imbricata]|uniref:Sushi domain-containing protein n=1 Tax=Pinctada imbricata TaxID=66713 RepID=A0AA88YCZ0_PINIB|nr:hypothetical protein FSP39_013610 [Pinctada imbricata]
MSFNCSQPSSISNGYFVVAKAYYENGDTLYYVCNTNYYVNGNPLITCDGSTGNWTGTTPSCQTTTTTTATDPTDEAWLWLAIALACLIGLLLLLILIVCLVKYCYNLCRRRSSRVTDIKKDYDEYVETGCCYSCCGLCCRGCCKCCFPKNNVPTETHVTKKQVKPKVITEHMVQSPRTTSVASETPKSTSDVNVLIQKDVKPAKELNMWMPHSKPMRNINTSTK